MKSYPTIPRQNSRLSYSYVFDKLDGSNIRAEWNPKKGFYKFGSRTRLLGTDQEFIAEAQELILEKYSAGLGRIFKKQQYPRAMAFFEFFGENSFAGTHHDEPHQVILLDVAPYKKGMTLPREFLKLYGDVGIPDLLFDGGVDIDIIQAVQGGYLPGVTFEGVVVKGADSKNGKIIQMFKIKSQAWLDALHKHCGDDDNLFERLK